MRELVLHFCEAFNLQLDSVSGGRCWSELQGVLSVKPLGKWYRPYCQAQANGQARQISNFPDTALSKRKLAGRVHRVGGLSPLASQVAELSLQKTVAALPKGVALPQGVAPVSATHTLPD